MADLPKDTRPDADFGELPPDQSWTPDDSSVNSAAMALGDSIRRGLSMTNSEGVEASDNMVNILLSVEKSMVQQTEILSKISNTLDSQLALNVENDQDADRAARLASVSEDEEKSKADPEAPTPTPLGRLKDKVAKTVMPQEDDSIMKKLAKAAALAASTFFVAKGFFTETSSMVTDKLVEKGIMKEETAQKVDDSIGKAGGISTTTGITQQVLKKGSFGKLKVPRAVPLMVGSGMGSLAYDGIGELADENDEILGMRKEIVQAIGGGITGIASFIASGKAMDALSKSMKKSMNIAKKRMGMKVKPDPDLKKGPAKVTDIKEAKKAKTQAKTQAKANVKTPPTSGNTALKTDPKPPNSPKANAKPNAKPSATPKPKSNVVKFPSAVNTAPSGKVVKGPQASKPTISQLLKEMPADKLARFSNLFRFLGPAAAVIPALIDPVMAIKNDEPDSVIRKELAGALGSVGGGVLGALAGGAAGTAVPGIGNAVGLFVGGTAGAFMGEYLVEKITSHLMGDNVEITKEEVDKVVGRGNNKKKIADKPSAVKAKIMSVPADKLQEDVDTASVELDTATAQLGQFKAEAGPTQTEQIKNKRGRVIGEKQVYADPEKQAQFEELQKSQKDAEFNLYRAKELKTIADEERANQPEPVTTIEEDMRAAEVEDVAVAQIKADEANKALSDFESSAKSARTVQKEDALGDMVDTVVYDDAAEQAQFDKLSGAKFDADYAVEDATSEMITGDSFDIPGQFEKLQFLQEKGFLPEGESQIVMGKFVGGPLSGMTPDEAISMYVTQESQIAKSASTFKSVPTIEADPTKTMTEDGKIPARVVPTTVKSAELSAVEERESQTKQAIKDFEEENASMMTKEDRGGGFTATKFSDPEKQKEYDALMDQAILDQEAVERQQVREAVDSGGIADGNYGRQNRLEDFRENEAASLNALKELKVAEKARDDAMMEAENTQDPIVKAKAEELRLAANKAKRKYRDANEAQLGKNQTVDGFNHNDQMETLMTQYNMSEADMNKLGIYKGSDAFGPSTMSENNLDAFKRQKDEEKLATLSTGITQVAGIESNPEKLMDKSAAVDRDAKEQDSLSRGAKVMQTNNNIDSSTKVDNRRGGNKTDIYITKGGSGSLDNKAHRPVPQSV